MVVVIYYKDKNMSVQKQKKVAIVLNEMSVGGIPKASISFMKQLLKYYEVTVILHNDKGELMDQIPKQVKIKVVPTNNTALAFRRMLSRKQYGKAIFFGIRYFNDAYISKRWVKTSTLLGSFNGYLIDDVYDVAIAYHGMSITQLTKTLFGINAKKKIAWIHGDHPFNGKHKQDVEKIYDMFDKIYCVSGTTRDKFLVDFPKVAEKTDVYYNLFEVDKIKQLSNQAVCMKNASDVITIVTVGRISREKGQEFIPPVLHELRKKGHRIQWYIVGDGDDRMRIEDSIKKYDLSDICYFTGMQSNPYPYIKNSDIYVQPSHTEGYPLTIFEAAILQKTIVATDVGGTREHLRSGEDVILVQPNVESIVSGIEKVIVNIELKKTLEKNLAHRDFSNQKEINKLLEYV